ncbi:MAG TPA: hypothetical protein VF534_30745, partial [Paraburkholderia sp.]
IGTRRVSTVGIMGQPLVIEVASTTETISDSTGRRKKKITSQTIAQGSGGVGNAAGGTGNNGQTSVIITAGRLSWRQINNYLDLKRGS